MWRVYMADGRLSMLAIQPVNQNQDKTFVSILNLRSESQIIQKHRDPLVVFLMGDFV